ncbi:hypothetical protein [Conexibacter sp. DBS9H8]|uniref:hypothetical protein n=1 Tax=Conexibacter sp. DBS9H8 TaxID=2937801 RepID=UPI00200DB67C|nr:hypothetical protein [Conexibacter sp. DBS9H8]
MLDDSPNDNEDGSMASSGKPKTTMAKLQREAALRERRAEKAARKQIRREAGPEAAGATPYDPWAALPTDPTPQPEPQATVDRS